MIRVSKRCPRLVVAGLALVALLVGVWWFLPPRPGAGPSPPPPPKGLYALDDGRHCLLRVTPDGAVTVALTEEDIRAATGKRLVWLVNRDIAFDPAGALYFTEGESNSILKYSEAKLSVLTSEEAIRAATGARKAKPLSLAFGGDGVLYVTEASAHAVLAVDPATGSVRVRAPNEAFTRLLPKVKSSGGVAAGAELGGGRKNLGGPKAKLSGGVAAGPGGEVYVATDSRQIRAVFAVGPSGEVTLLHSGPPFEDLDLYMTRAPGGDLIVADDRNLIHRVTPQGAVSTFLSAAQLRAGGGVRPDLEGGIAFDSAGNFYVALGPDTGGGDRGNQADRILRFDSSLKGSVFVAREAIEAATGVRPRLQGIAFAPGTEPPPPDRPPAAGGEPPAPAGGPTVAPEARAQTVPVPHGGGAADDPAIWVHPTDPEKSLILGTDKYGGLHVYNLDGSQHQLVADGAQPKNVDVLYDFELGGRVVDLAVAGVGAKAAPGVKVWAIDPATRTLADVTAGGTLKVLGGRKPNGSCTYRSAKTGRSYFFVNGKDGRGKDGQVEQYLLEGAGGGTVRAREVRAFSAGSRAKGCVADDELGHLYIAAEKRGIWKYGAEPDAGDAGTLIAKVGDQGLTANVEGLTIYYASGGKGYLLASSQGSDTFKVYAREGDNRFLLTIDPKGGDIDDVSHTDGIAVTNRPTSRQFRLGVFVAQDGKNAGGNQNFKLYAWEDIAGSRLIVDPGWSPRATERRR